MRLAVPPTATAAAVELVLWGFGKHVQWILRLRQTLYDFFVYFPNKGKFGEEHWHENLFPHTFLPRKQEYDIGMAQELQDGFVAAS